MRCKACQHILWNQPAPSDGSARVCPECGTAYTLAAFGFKPGTVKFCCRHCATAYYGTSPEGHLEPSAFNCAVCANPITMEECVVTPHDAMADVAAMLREPLPWFEQGPLLSRWWRTVCVGLKKASSIHTRLTEQPNIGRAVAFLSLHAWISGVVSAVLGVVMSLGAFNMLFGGGLNAGLNNMFAVQVASYIAYPLYMLFAAVVAAWAVSLASVEGLSFKRAFEIIVYSSGVLLYMLIPFCGGFIGLILWAIAASQAIAAAAPKDRATSPVILLLVGGFAALVLEGLFGLGISMLTRF